ncbi:MAG: Triosephosphate isomerase [Candidatus Hydrogenedentes bacterium ADurb.Bin101]|jgi:triosephosphate isomerase|nr:MAG: Triosephosphate isomerase [Candidatus Hydrogenedentes bacterium ADurb.Bin101]HOC68887.1 triose-phosphate isomerase [Candidatus Hydrogenedentota bacterium]
MALRKAIVAGNWKMNNLVAEAVALAEEVRSSLGQVRTVDVAVCPTYTSLYAVGKALEGSLIQLGAQDAYIKPSGAFTGEISPQMLLDVGCMWTIIGHSERRHVLGESDALQNAKTRFALSSGLKVMFCIGELLDERKANITNKVLERQLTLGLAGLSPENLENVVIAYEPVWAIGTGETASPEQAEEAHVFIRGWVAKVFGDASASQMRIQYGGSVTPKTVEGLFEKENIDGFLVGGASLKPVDFAVIVQACA